MRHVINHVGITIKAGTVFSGDGLVVKFCVNDREKGWIALPILQLGFLFVSIKMLGIDVFILLLTNNNNAEVCAQTTGPILIKFNIVVADNLDYYLCYILSA